MYQEPKLSAALSKWCLAECPFWLCWCSIGFSLRIVSYARTRSRTERTRALAAYWRILQGPGCYSTALCLPALLGAYVRSADTLLWRTCYTCGRPPCAARRLSKNNLDGCSALLFNDCTLGKIIHIIIWFVLLPRESIWERYIGKNVMWVNYNSHSRPTWIYRATDKSSNDFRRLFWVGTQGDLKYL